ncbi:MBL fold metallo-hydrolase [Methanopyrus sp.]
MPVGVVVVRPGYLERGADGSVLRADSASVLLITDEVNLLVDVGCERPGRLIRRLKPYGVDAVVFTHGHHDHVGNAEEVRRAFEPDFYAHPKEAESIPVEVDDVDRLDPPEGVEIVETPGHTPGHVSVAVEDHLIVAGDACPTPDNAVERVPPAVAWDRERARESLERVLSYPTVIPGHGVHVRR